MNTVAQYLASNRERLRLDELGVPANPICLLLSPRFRLSRHVIGLVLGKRGSEPVLVAKLPRLAGDGEALAREAAALDEVGRALDPRDDGTVPRLVAFDEGLPHPMLLETALSGRPLSPTVVRRDRDGIVEQVALWLERLALATAADPGDDSWYERLVVGPLRTLAASPDEGVSGLAERTFALAQPLRDARPPLVLVHGDLGHPNLLRQRDGRLGVLDWEHADPAGLPAHDLVFFLAYAAMAAARDGRKGSLAGVREAFFGADAWAWPVLRRYASRVGIDEALLMPLVTVCSARIVALTGGARRGPLASTARDATARHMLLWRHGVAAQDDAPARLTSAEGL